MKNILSAMAVVLLLNGCSTYTKIYSDYDQSTDFTKYKTFAWLPDKADTVSLPYNYEIIRNNIRNYFGQCMSDRGYTVDLEKPDILMQVVVSNAKKERTVSTYPTTYYYRPYYLGSLYYSPYPYRYYYHGYQTFNYAYPGSTSTQKQEYWENAITLNLIDARSRQLVWTGTAQGDVYDPAYLNKDIHPAVHSIISNYPVNPLAGKSHRVK